MNKTLPHNHGNITEQLQTEIPSKETLDDVSEVFKLLSDSTRIQIFWLLCHCEECVVNISALLMMSSPAVSHHLKLLKAAGLVISRREGKEVYYTVCKTPRSEILHQTVENMLEVACPVAKAFEENRSYGSVQQIVNEIHNLLISNPEKRYTLSRLAADFHINQTTLKTVFKALFGKSISAYMKEYRIKKAMEYLIKTDKPIAHIAGEVGYESQSKFTVVFKEITGILPKDYRKIHRKNGSD